jgi:hypothetical protein
MRLQSIEEEYENSRLLIFKVCHRMSDRYYVPFEDTLGEAHAIFLNAYSNYDPTRGAKFSTWLQSRLKWDLTTWLQNEYAERLNVDLDQAANVACSQGHLFFLSDLLFGLSDTSKLIIRLVLNTPSELTRIMKWERAEGRNDIKRNLREYLAHLGWGPREVNKGFREIRRALADPVPDRPVKPKERALKRAKLTRSKVWHLTRKPA